MIIIHLTPDDLFRVRFAYSPMLELATSFRLLAGPEDQAPFYQWVQQTQRALFGENLPYLSALIPDKGLIPDFLTPTPLTSEHTIEDEIQEMLALPDTIIRKNVQLLIDGYGNSEIRSQFMAYPREMLYCLADELRLYWRRALEAHWARLTAILEGDLLYRGRQMALQGSSALFNDLNPSMNYEPGQIRLHKQKPCVENNIWLDGKGIQLVPHVFAAGHHVYWQINEDWHPMLIYGARGLGLWRQLAPQTNQSLELALGPGRAQILQGLTTPSNTGELARRLHLTAGAVSQQLSRLNQAGLVEPHRSGRRVYYHLTSRGEQLLSLFDPAS